MAFSASRWVRATSTTRVPEVFDQLLQVHRDQRLILDDQHIGRQLFSQISRLACGHQDCERQATEQAESPGDLFRYRTPRRPSTAARCAAASEIASRLWLACSCVIAPHVAGVDFAIDRNRTPQGRGTVCRESSGRRLRPGRTEPGSAMMASRVSTAHRSRRLLWLPVNARAKRRKRRQVRRDGLRNRHTGTLQRRHYAADIHSDRRQRLWLRIKFPALEPCVRPRSLQRMFDLGTRTFRVRAIPRAVTVGAGSTLTAGAAPAGDTL